jgi:hypothetical protein
MKQRLNEALEVGRSKNLVFRRSFLDPFLQPPWIKNPNVFLRSFQILWGWQRFSSESELRPHFLHTNFASLKDAPIAHPGPPIVIDHPGTRRSSFTAAIANRQLNVFRSECLGSETLPQPVMASYFVSHARLISICIFSPYCLPNRALKKEEECNGFAAL